MFSNAITRLLVAATIALFSASSASSASPKGTFEAGKRTFLLNGKPYVVKAAELHYPRIPRPYWDHRIKLCKALGMNTVCLYVFWNAHEPRPDEFDFSGNNNLREFVKLCQANGMNVILRPGPYVCAEWEMGGLPWWLLKKKDIRLRDNDPYFLERVDKFQKAVAGQLSDLTIANGGPVIMVQVENEYGSYGTNKPYVANIRDMLRRNFGPEVALFQCDWASNFLNNGLDDLIWTMNFGAGADIDKQFEKLREVRPESPLMCSEYWSGWFDKWGANHETRPASELTEGIDEMLSKGISFSLYMTHGGTNWGHWAGANSPGYQPDVTSYDYDAPISESGAVTPKYKALRAVMAKYAGGKLPPVPEDIPTMKIDEFRLMELTPLWELMRDTVRSDRPLTMEELDLGFGSVDYRTTLPATSTRTLLTIGGAHDYAQVFIDGRPTGVIDRRNAESNLVLPPLKKGQRLDILVEAMGRINFGRAVKDFKGITGDVTITENRDGHDFVCRLGDWEMYRLPDSLEFYTSQRFIPLAATPGRKPAGVYRGWFKASHTDDTFLDMSGWGKGFVYVNGHPLGRFWSIGPQQTLYCPGAWLRKGDNEIVVFDILGPESTAIRGLREPVLDKLSFTAPAIHRKAGESLDLSAEKPALSGSFAAGNGWQEVQLPAPAEGRYICLEALDAHDGEEAASIAEIYLLDEKGERISREGWRAVYADSEDTERGNLTADKTFDLQESTSWATPKGVPFPHTIVIDLGGNRRVSAIQYLPRAEAGAPGSIKGFRLYVSQKPFDMGVR